MVPVMKDQEASEIKVVLIDWAGTLTIPMTDMVRLAATQLDLPNDDLAKILMALSDYFTSDDSLFHRAERGEVADEELFSWLEAQVPGASRLFETDEPSLLTAPDRPEMIDLLWWLQDLDVSVLLATNNLLSAQDVLASRYLDSGLVHAIVNSALVGARKPEPEFWGIVLEATMVEPSEMVLLDDNTTNIESAAALGIQTVLVGNDSALAVAQLKALLNP